MHSQTRRFLFLAVTGFLAVAGSASARPILLVGSEIGIRSDGGDSIYNRAIAHYLGARDDLPFVSQIFKRGCCMSRIKEDPVPSAKAAGKAKATGPPPLTHAQVGEAAANVLKKQNAAQQKQVQKDRVNQATLNTVPPAPKTPGFSKMNREQRAKVESDKAKDLQKAKSQAITNAQKQNKQDKKAMWESKKLDPAAQARKKDEKAERRKTGIKGPATTPSTKQPKMHEEHRQQVNDALRNAGQRMQNTNNIPGRKDEFKVGTQTWTGKEARKGVMNSNLHANAPTGPGANLMPKTFRNDPYAPDHPNAALAGKPAIPGLPAGHPDLKEYPVVNHSPSGWHGPGSPGPARVVTSTDASGRDTFHGVISHDKKAGGSADDHYLATHTART